MRILRAIDSWILERSFGKTAHPVLHLPEQRADVEVILRSLRRPWFVVSCGDFPGMELRCRHVSSPMDAERAFVGLAESFRFCSDGHDLFALPGVAIIREKQRLRHVAITARRGRAMGFYFTVFVSEQRNPLDAVQIDTRPRAWSQPARQQGV